MFRTILLPIDATHTESWEKALPAAQAIAGETGAIHILGIVHDLGVAMVSSYLPEDFEKTAMERLKADLGAFAADKAPGATIHVGHGHVPETILRLAADVGADLVVMASHPPNELKTLLIGSYADKVVRHSPIPVLVVR